VRYCRPDCYSDVVYCVYYGYPSCPLLSTPGLVRGKDSEYSQSTLLRNIKEKKVMLCEGTGSVSKFLIGPKSMIANQGCETLLYINTCCRRHVSAICCSQNSTVLFETQLVQYSKIYYFQHSSLRLKVRVIHIYFIQILMLFLVGLKR
jgi:hypothetical protein